MANGIRVGHRQGEGSVKRETDATKEILRIYRSLSPEARRLILRKAEQIGQAEKLRTCPSFSFRSAQHKREVPPYLPG